MRVLVACEFSGVVRDAFLARGHDAYSCDVIDSERGPERHLRCDALKILDDSWDLLVGHPPCTYLTNAGSKHLYMGCKLENGPDEERWDKMRAGAEFFNALLAAPIPRICVENPIMHRHARALISEPYAQIVQPFQFGHCETKATCLWLKGLPKLAHTEVLPPPYNPRVHFASPGPNRWKERSRTLTGIARAMAEQWG